MALPNQGTLQYGDVSFDSLFSVKVQARAMANDSGRTTKYVEHSIEASGHVAEPEAGVKTDGSLEEMRQLLTVHGQPLRFFDKGYGELNVNIAGGVKDVNWGPRPQLVSWRPVGNDRGAYVEWRCTTCVPETAGFRDTGIVTYDYDVAFDVDGDGYTVVTHSGYLEIALSRRNGGRTVAENVDTLRKRVCPPPILGFRRQQRWHVSQDRRRLEFTVTDTQMPFPLPPGVSAATAKHRMSSSLRQGFAIWNGSISGNVQIPPHETKRDAWSKVLLIALSRIGSPVVGGQVRAALGVKKATLIEDIEIADDVFGRGLDFGFSYRVLGTSLDEILTRSGFLQPVPTATFKDWKESHEGRTWSPNGSAGLFWNKDHDLIVDLGTRQQPKVPTYAPKLDRDGRSRDPKPGKQKIDPNNSWVYHECDVQYEEFGRVVKHVPLGPPPEPPKGGMGIGGAVAAAAGAVAGKVAAAIGGVAAKLQVLGSPQPSIRLIGRAIRLGHQIPRPTIESIGGMKVGVEELDIKLAEVIYKHRATGAGFDGEPMYIASWNILYRLPKQLSPDFAPTTANVVLNVDGNVR